MIIKIKGRKFQNVFQFTVQKSKSHRNLKTNIKFTDSVIKWTLCILL